MAATRIKTGCHHWLIRIYQLHRETYCWHGYGGMDGKLLGGKRHPILTGMGEWLG